jgi:Flp pilus assembly secretin CpaC
LAVAAVALPASAFAQPGASTLHDALVVHVDQAALLKLPEGTATLVIGNPLIADAAVQGGAMVITAKSYGMTNLMVLGRNGEALAEYPIQVVGPTDKLVVVYRGIERETYSCEPKCEKRITIGDSLQYFTQNLNALSVISSQAGGQAR